MHDWFLSSIGKFFPFMDALKRGVTGRENKVLLRCRWCHRWNGSRRLIRWSGHSDFQPTDRRAPFCELQSPLDTIVQDKACKSFEMARYLGAMDPCVSIFSQFSRPQRFVAIKTFRLALG